MRVNFKDNLKLCKSGIAYVGFILNQAPKTASSSSKVS